MKAWKVALALVVVVAALTPWREVGRILKAPPAGAATPPAAMLMPIPVTKIVKQTLPIYLDYAARTEPIDNVTLQTKISGYLKRQLVVDGADVKQGDLLYEIDPRDLQAALDQAGAQAQRDTASIEYLKSNFDRGAELAKTGFLGKDAYDQRGSTLHQAEASLAMDQAQIRAAQLNLAYAEIHAPFDGRMGRNQAAIGTLIGAGTTVLNNLVRLDPIYVTFNPSETDLAAIGKARASGRVIAEVFPPGATKPSDEGELTFIDNMVDRATGTITARATIANHDYHLLPGQYVRVRLRVEQRPDMLMAPRTAIGSSQLGKYVYVIGAGNTVDLRLVALGPTDGDRVAITGNVAEGDQVIVGNLQKIGPGMPVQPMPSK